MSLKKNQDSFLIYTEKASPRAAKIVIATGYFDCPTPFDIPGADLPKVKRYYDEPHGYSDRDVAVVGGSNSAVEIVLDLYRNGSRVTLIHRGKQLSQSVKYWIKPDIENRIARSEIRAMFESSVKEVRKSSIIVSGKHQEELKNDIVFVMIGYQPDVSLLSEAGVEIDRESMVPQHNPESFETNIPGLFLAGSMAAGKYTNKIFIENGRLHGKRIIESILRAD